MKTYPRLFAVTMNGIDVSSYLYKGTFMKDNRQPVKYGTFSFNKKINDVLTVADTLVGKSFLVQRGFDSATERYMFRGEVVSYKLLGSVYEFSVADKLYGCVKRERDYTYEKDIDTQAGVGSEIAKDLLTIGGVSYSTTSVPTTGTDATTLIVTYPAKGTCLDSLKDLSKVYNRQLFYKDSDDLGYFVPQGYTATSLILDVGTDVINRVQWTTTGQDMANNVTLIGGQQLDWAYETFETTGATSTFTLLAKPVDTDVFLEGAKLQRGVNSSDPKDFYVTENSLVFTTNPNLTLDIYYSYNVPIKVSSADYASINDYTQRDATVVNDKLKNSLDAELKINGFLDQSADVLTTAPLRVIGNNTIEVGDQIRITDDVNNIDTTGVVQSLTYTFPYKPDEIVIGKMPVQSQDITLQIIDNINRLQRQLSSETDISVQLINSYQELEIGGYTELSKATADVGVLYWDSEVQGIWDSYDWGTDTEETYTQQSITYINGYTVT